MSNSGGPVAVIPSHLHATRAIGPRTDGEKRWHKRPQHDSVLESSRMLPQDFDIQMMFKHCLQSRPIQCKQ